MVVVIVFFQPLHFNPFFYPVKRRMKQKKKTAVYAAFFFLTFFGAGATAFALLALNFSRRPAVSINLFSPV